MGLQQRIDSAVVQIELVAGTASHGFESVTLNGKQLSVGHNATITSQRGEKQFAISFTDSHFVTVHTPLFDYEFENSDMFINENVVTNVALNRLQTHGLLGQTWQSKIYNGTVKYIEGEVDDYSILDDEIFGTNFMFNAFSVVTN